MFRHGDGTHISLLTARVMAARLDGTFARGRPRAKLRTCEPRSPRRILQARGRPGHLSRPAADARANPGTSSWYEGTSRRDSGPTEPRVMAPTQRAALLPRSGDVQRTAACRAAAGGRASTTKD